MAGQRTDTELVLAARADDAAAYGELFERWFDRAWNVARTIVRDDDLAADVAQDTMVKAWQQLGQLRDPDAFGGWVLRSTRNRALNRLAREGRSRATGDDVVSGLRDRGSDDPVGAERQPEPDVVSEIRDRQELVWAAATALGERDVSLLDLHLRHGLSPAEIADELGVEANAAHQQLFRLRGRLGDAIGSYLLWRNGRPLCDGLAKAVSGRTAFDRSVAKAVARHQAGCDHCSEERSSLVDPAKLFAAVPLLLVPPHLKAEAAAALQSVGVPTSSSASGAEGSGPDAAGSGPESEVNGVDGNGSAPDGSAPDGSSPDGLQLDVGSAPNPISADGPAFALADEATGPGPGSAALAPMRTISRSRAVVLAGVGVVVIVAVIGLASLALRDDGGGDDVATIASADADDPELLAGDQGAAGDAGDPAGPASFIPSSATGGTTAPPSSTSRTSTGNSTTRRPTTATTGTTANDPDPTPSVTVTRPDPTPSVTPTVTVTRPDPTPSVTPTVTVTQPDPTPSVTPTVTVTQPDPTPSVTDPADAPRIVRFIATALGGSRLCPDPNQRPFETRWSTEHADSVTLTLPNSTRTDGPSGSYQFCGSTGQVITLVAAGPGGTDKATASLL